MKKYDITRKKIEKGLHWHFWVNFSENLMKWKENGIFRFMFTFYSLFRKISSFSLARACNTGYVHFAISQSKFNQILWSMFWKLALYSSFLVCKAHSEPQSSYEITSKENLFIIPKLQPFSASHMNRCILLLLLPIIMKF